MLSTPSLGITRHDQILHDRQRNFQLPLSGSRGLIPFLGWPAVKLSTPSLGITACLNSGEQLFSREELSTPSLGITWCNHHPTYVSCPLTPFNSLSRDHNETHNLKRTYPEFPIAFNSLSRDHRRAAVGRVARLCDGWLSADERTRRAL